MGLFANGFDAIIANNWLWLLAAFAIGAVIGWRTCGQVTGTQN